MFPRPEGVVVNWLKNLAESGRVIKIAIRFLKPFAGQQAGACGETFGGIVGLSIQDSVFRQLIEMGRLDFRAHATEIRVAHVISKDDKNVRLWSSERSDN